MVGQPVMFDATVGTVLPGLESLHLYLVVTSLKWSWGCVICSGILACAIHNLIIQWKSGALVLLYGTAEQKTPYVISGNHVSYCDNVALVRKMFSCFPSIFFFIHFTVKANIEAQAKVAHLWNWFNHIWSLSYFPGNNWLAQRLMCCRGRGC